MCSKVEEDPQRFVNEMEKVFRVMHACNAKGDKFVTYD